MIKRIIKIISVCLALLAIPLSLMLSGLLMPAQFGKTYYGVLPKMYERLQRKSEKKRIVFVGGSGLAFGLRGDLIESELNAYMVCPFGLYGAIGTKAMMDLSRENIREGDIVVLAPEQNPQSLSLYFSGEQLWKGIDGNLDMLRSVASENVADMVGAYPKYISEKYAAFTSGSELDPEGIYNAASFDDACTMTYERAYNCMVDGYDKGDPISYQTDIFGAGFLEYVNEYNAYIEEKGGTLLYGFTPVNILGIAPETAATAVDEFYDYLEEELDCRILGDPNDYLLSSGWFYDSNVHVNSAGSIVYTRQLTNDLKLFLRDTSETKIELPDMPEVPEEEDAVGPDGKDAAMFTYEQKGNGWTVTGLTEEGANRTELEIPDFYQGKKVRGFAAATFAGNTAIERVYIGRYIKEIEANAFDGCANLKAICLSKQAKADDCRIGKYSFDGMGRFTIYVPEAEVENYLYDYFWRNVGDKIKGY